MMRMPNLKGIVEDMLGFEGRGADNLYIRLCTRHLQLMVD